MQKEKTAPPLKIAYSPGAKPLAASLYEDSPYLRTSTGTPLKCSFVTVARPKGCADLFSSTMSTCRNPFLAFCEHMKSFTLSGSLLTLNTNSLVSLTGTRKDEAAPES